MRKHVVLIISFSVIVIGLGAFFIGKTKPKASSPSVVNTQHAPVIPSVLQAKTVPDTRFNDVPIAKPINQGEKSYYTDNYAAVASDSLRSIASPENEKTLEAVRRKRAQRLAERTPATQQK